MSFISVYAMENFITVMSDGLVINLEENIIGDENYKKFKMISPKQFMAFGGTHELGKIIKKWVGYSEEERDLFALTHKFRDLAINSPYREKQKCQLIFAGIEKGQIIFYSFNNNPNQEILSEAPKGERQTYTMLSSKHSKVKPVDEMERLIRLYDPKTAESALELQEKLNRIIAENDITVNNVVFKTSIEN